MLCILFVCGCVWACQPHVLSVVGTVLNRANSVFGGSMKVKFNVTSRSIKLPKILLLYGIQKWALDLLGFG